MENLNENTNNDFKTEKSKKSHKFLIMNLVYIILILALAGGGVYGYFYLTEAYEVQYTEAYSLAVAEQESVYAAAKKQYDEAYTHLLEEEADWKASLEKKQMELNLANEELAEIYAQRQKDIDDENNRWNALSAEEQEAELICRDYNAMVSELRSTNPEYAQLYVEYAAYLTRDIFNLSREEALAYTELYAKKRDIEQTYRELQLY